MQALELLNRNERTEAAIQLTAQLHYRLEQYDTAIREYRELFDTYSVADPEVKTNVLAAHAAAGQAADVDAVSRTLGISAADSFETAFNLACCMLQRGDLDQARDLLLLGIRTGVPLTTFPVHSNSYNLTKTLHGIQRQPRGTAQVNEGFIPTSHRYSVPKLESVESSSTSWSFDQLRGQVRVNEVTTTTPQTGLCSRHLPCLQARRACWMRSTRRNRWSRSLLRCQSSWPM